MDLGLLRLKATSGMGTKIKIKNEKREAHTGPVEGAMPKGCVWKG
jgi:hypothetical protein